MEMEIKIEMKKKKSEKISKHDSIIYFRFCRKILFKASNGSEYNGIYLTRSILNWL